MALFMLAGESEAAAIKVLSSHALQRLVEEMTLQFERSTGHTLSLSYDPALAIKRRIENGTQFDAVLITRAAIDDLTRQGRIAPGTCVDLARSGLGVAVRKGLPKPDMGSVQAFKDALLAAKSVVRSTEGTSGVYFEKLLGQLGIAEQMKHKIVLGPSGRVAELAARGEVDMAVQQISEIVPVSGIEFVGPFPAEVQLTTTFSGAVSASSTRADAAKALLALLASRGLASILRDSGLEQPER
jgi:molybdate transport system substrate-binding protein